MCGEHQSATSNCKRMAGLTFAICLIITVIVFVVIGTQGSPHSKLEEVSCGGSDQCLIPTQCSKYDQTDLHYECGRDERGRIKVCCAGTNPLTVGGTGEPPILGSLGPPPIDNRYHNKELFSDDCGSSEIDDKIANGKNASIGQFPWMALLGYTTKRIKIPQYLCGGSLINQRYVLTAAHCLNIKSMILTVVRLGEVNIATPVDCQIERDGSSYCSDPPVDVNVELAVSHEGYDSSTLKNDIGLIRLAKNVTQAYDPENAFIKTICLPFNLNVDETALKKSLSISGWGKTSASSIGVSSILQYTSVNTWDLKRCNKFVPTKVRPLDDRQTCATGDTFQEACKGDSGGPLTFNHGVDGQLKTVQVGVVSFKSLDTCGTEDIPTIFTKVDRYLDWIVSKVEP